MQQQPIPPKPHQSSKSSTQSKVSVEIHAPVEPDDTSVDAGDFSSQQDKECVNPAAKAKPSVVTSEEDSNERDENFVIESDNIDDKLYSSQSSRQQTRRRPEQETRGSQEKPRSFETLGQVAV